MGKISRIIIILLAIFLCLFLVFASRFVYDFTSTQAINATICVDASSFTPNNPPNALPPACGAGDSYDHTTDSALDYRDSVNISRAISANAEGYHYFIFNLSAISDINTISSINFTILGSTTSSSATIYWYVYNVTSSDWLLLNTSFPSNVVSFDWTHFRTNSTTNFSEFVDVNKNIYLLLTENTDNSVSLKTDYVSVIVITQDTENPQVNIFYPQSTIYDHTISTINFTSSDDTGLDTCWYSLNNGATNSTTDCTANVTGLDSGEGSFNWTMWVNDTIGKVNFSVVNFTVAYLPPSIDLNYPPDNTFFNYRNNIYLNYTATDPNDIANCSVWHNITGTFSLNSTNYGVTSGQQNFTKVNVSVDGRYLWNVECFDTTERGDFNENNFTFIVDTSGPTINIVVTPNGTNVSSAIVWINYTISDTLSTISSCKWTKNNGATNTSLASCGTNITDTFLEGVNTVIIYGVDNLGNEGVNSTTFYVDTTAPSLSIISPVDGQSFSTGTINLNYTVSDSGVGLSSCWYKNNTGINITIACGTNTTLSQGSDGTYTVYIWVNDTLNNIASHSHIWTVSADAPTVNLISPINHQWYNNGSDILFNFTSEDSNGVDTCELWGNWTGEWHKNQSKMFSGDLSVNVEEGFFKQNISEGLHLWNVWCNDSTSPNKATFATLNRTFGVDITKPIVSIITTTTTLGTNVITLHSNVTDINIGRCWFNIYNSSGGFDSLTPENTSIDCIEDKLWSVSAYGSYTLVLYANDSARNENNASESFSTSATSGGPGGGGGSPNITVVEISNKTFCGDGICQVSGNDNGLKEDFFTCEQDCPPANIDTSIFGCFDDDPNTPCIWDQQGFQIIGLTAGILLLFVSLAKVKDERGNNITTISYVYKTFKKKRKKR